MLPVTQLSVLLFSSLSGSPHSGSPVLPRSFRSSGPSPYLRPGFPCLPSSSAYSAFCSFPFVLPCFAPTAVPQVLTSSPRRFLRFPFACSRAARFLSSTSGLEPDYSASVSSFPFFMCSPHSGSHIAASVPVSVSGLHLLFPFPVPAYLPSLRPVSMPSFRIRYSALLRFLSTAQFASQLLPSVHDLCSTLPLPFRPFPLACALGSVYSAGTTYPEN